MGVVIAVLVSCLLAALATAAWPVTVALAAVIAAVLVVAVRAAPGCALAAAVLLFGLEGSIKLLLGLEPTPFPADARSVGAAALDLTMLVAVVAVLARAPLGDPRAWWAQRTRGERAVLLALAGWLTLSVAQIAQGGDIARGLEGFRLTQAYVIVAVAAAIATARPRAREVVPAVVLAIGAVVAGYAALRVAIGPAQTEERAAIVGGSTAAYDGVLRGVGSFSSAVGLGSFLTPLAVFALVTAYLVPRLRWAAAAVAALSLVAILGSYGRGPLLAIVIGLVVALVVLGSAADFTRRRRLIATALMVGGLSVLYGGVVVAGQASPQLRDRVGGVLNPLGDESVRERLTNWDETLRESVRTPLGRGVGTVGAASADERRLLVTTDNSYLKQLVEQGLIGGGLFIVVVIGAVVVLGRRLARASPQARAPGLAALGAFAAFLALAATGEYVEQPGKVLAWACLGVAVAACLQRGQPSAPAAAATALPDARALVLPASRRGRALAGVAAAMLVLVPAGVSLARAPTYTSSSALTPIDTRGSAFVPRTPRPRLLGDPTLRYLLLPVLTENAVWLEDLDLGREKRRLVLRATATTPQRAQRVATAFAAQTVAASSRGIMNEGLVSVTARATRPAVERPVDRVLDALPGELPGRASPFWAALAGLVVLAGARAIWLVLDRSAPAA